MSKKVLISGLVAALLLTGCGDDKKVEAVKKQDDKQPAKVTYNSKELSDLSAQTTAMVEKVRADLLKEINVLRSQVGKVDAKNSERIQQTGQKINEAVSQLNGVINQSSKNVMGEMQKLENRLSAKINNLQEQINR